MDIIISNDFSSIYRIYHAAGIKNKPYPIYGQTLQFKCLAQKFVETQDKSEAIDLAKKALDLVAAHRRVIRYHTFKEFELFFFKIPEPRLAWVKPKLLFYPEKLIPAYSPELPWNRHLEWSKTEVAIQKLLYLLGVTPLVKIHYPEDEKKLLGYKLEYSDQNKVLIELQKGNKKFKNGHVYAVPEEIFIYKKPPKFSIAHEIKSLKDKDESANSLVIDWALFEKNTFEFYQKNHWGHA